MSDLIGQQFGHYRLVRFLGEGGFADVYQGEHIHLGATAVAAIKVLHTRLASEDVERFREEARVIWVLKHPNIVPILDFGVQGNTPFLVMEYALFGTLRKVHPRGSILPASLVVSYVKQVAAALQYAHDQRVIHRDIKPENMLQGRNKEVLLSDFGLALIAQSILTQSMNSPSTSDAAGTIYYMAPEQLEGKPRPASDLYSLAVVAYEWLTGERPFAGSSYVQIAMQHKSTPPPPLRSKVPTISPDVEEVVLHALAKDPQQRFMTVQAFANALEQASIARPAQSSSLTNTPTVATLSPSESSIPTRLSEQPAITASLSGGPSGRILLGSSAVTIGRKQGDLLLANDLQVSTRHAEIRPEGQGYSIVDLGSTNGTFINGQRLEASRPRLLNSGDAIRIGETQFLYEVSAASSSEQVVSDGSTKRAPAPITPLPLPGYAGSQYGSGGQQPLMPPLPPSEMFPPQMPPPVQQPMLLPQFGAPAYAPPPPATMPVGGPNYFPPPQGPTSPFNPNSPSGLGFQSGQIAPTPAPKPNRKMLWIIVSVVAALVVIVGSVFAYMGYVNSQSTSTKTLDAFCSAVQSGDYQTAYSQFSGKFQSKYPRAEFDGFFAKISSCTHSSPNQSSSNATASLTTASTGTSGTSTNDQVTLTQDSGNTWKIDDVARFTALTMSLDTFCQGLQTGDTIKARGEFSGPLQQKLSEALFAAFFPHTKTCTSTAPVVSNQGAMTTFMIVSTSGQAESHAVTLTYDGTNWKIDSLMNLPDNTLDTFCTALQGKDYQAAYNQRSSGYRASVTELGFMNFLSNFTSCTHDPVALTSQGTKYSTIMFPYASSQTDFIAVVILDSDGNWKIDLLVNPPGNTLTRFCNALQTGDYQAAYNLLAPSFVGNTMEPQFATGFATITCTISGFPTQAGPTATTAMASGVTFTNSSTGRMITQTATLVEDNNGNWLIANLQ